MTLTNWQQKQRKEAYDRYLRSPQWQGKKFDVFRRDGYICQICKSNPASQVHHLTYERFGDEPLDDLQAVCKPCHKEHHNK
jgi:5-methylcytosine-specific restriction endonuclease McrA